ncbi:MAG: HEAT repeat domain-containing protein [Myxococcales bacterium]|nr:HEAT repeat domain-containing protein [Myxococcales bacterium]
MSLDEEAIAEKLAELEPAWAGRPNVFTREIAANDVESISARLGDSLPAIRGDAAEALGQLKSVAALPKLKAMLQDADPSARRSAAIALASLGNEEIAKEFVKNLVDASAKVVAGAAMALGLARYKAAVPYLLKAYRTEHPRVAAAVAIALGQLGDRQAVPWLVTAMKTGLAPVEAAAALGELRDPAATRPLCDALGHELPALRAAAARSLGRLAQAGSIDFVLKDQALASLHKLIADADERVRFCAALALAGFGDPVGKKQLTHLLAT